MRTIYRRLWLALGLLALLIGALLVGTRPALAQRAVSDDEVNAIARNLYCPVCESEPLDTCATQACQDWREEIRVQLSEGASEAEVYDYFQSRFGDRVLAAPPARGLNLILWLGIPVALVVGGLWFARYLRSITTPAAPRGSVPAAATNGQHNAGPPAGDDRFLRQIEEELNK